MSLLENKISLLDFMKIHYYQNDDIESYLYIMARTLDYKLSKKLRKQRVKMYPYRKLNTIQIKNCNNIDLDFRKNIDYYITANGMKNTKDRSSDNVFTYYNIVIDIDCHNPNVYIEGKKVPFSKNLDVLLYHLEQLFEDRSMPTPNSIVTTGRGIQLWFAIEPMSYKLKAYYKATRAYILDKLDEEVMSEKTLTMFSLDRSASIKDGGLFRLPETVNTKSNTNVVVYNIHDERLNCLEIVNECNLLVKKEQPLIRKITNTNLYKYREGILYSLTKLRDFDMTNFRDKICLILHSAYMTAGKTIEEANEAILKLNKTFKKPLKETELLSYMSTSSNKKYYFTNEKIIEYLDISNEEQNILAFFAAKDNQKIRMKKRKEKKSRNQKIIVFFLQGLTQIDIANKVGCSQPTICRVIKKYLNSIKAKVKSKIDICKSYISKRANNLKNKIHNHFTKYNFLQLNSVRLLT